MNELKWSDFEFKPIKPIRSKEFIGSTNHTNSIEPINHINYIRSIKPTKPTNLISPINNEGDSTFTIYNSNKIYRNEYKIENPYLPILPTTFSGYIHHNIPEIENEAPSLHKWFRDLMVTRHDLEGDIDPKNRSKSLKDREPNEKFFKDVNDSFICSLSRNRSISDCVPLYFYNVNKKGEIEHLSIPEARLIYGKMYEKIMLKEGSESLKLILKMKEKCNECKLANKSIILRTENTRSNHSIDDVRFRVLNTKLKFTFELCLIEILIHYPNSKEYFWNKYTIRKGIKTKGSKESLYMVETNL